MARLVDEHAELVFRWLGVTCRIDADDLHARYEFGLLWRGEPVLNPAITDPSPPGPDGGVTRFNGLTPGFVGGSDHDASFLTAFRHALGAGGRTGWEDMEPFTTVQFCPGGVDHLEPDLRSWNRDRFDILVLLTPAQLRHPPGAEWALMGLAGAPALYVTASRAGATAFFFDLVEEYLGALSPDDRARAEEGASLQRLLVGLDRAGRTVAGPPG